MDFLQVPRATAGGALVLLTLLGLAGCAKDDGLSDLERQNKRQESVADTLREAGVKATKVRYPQGEAWDLNLSGLTVTNQTLEQLKSVGRIAHLDLSASTITDEQMDCLNQPELGGLLVKLDLSNTAVTDEGLDRLTNLIVLYNLNLSGTKVTSAGVQRFRARRQEDPKIKIKNTNIHLR